MRYCRWCGKETDINLKSCSNCGANQQSIFKKLKPAMGIIVFIIVVIVLIFISGVFAKEAPIKYTQEAVKTSDGALEIISKSLIRDGSFMYITGTIRNNRLKPFSRAEVTFNLYDKANNQVGTAMDTIYNLEGKATWKYRAMVTAPDSDMASYKALILAGWD